MSHKPGRGMTGLHPSPESRAKMSTAKMGRHRTPETRAKISATLKGCIKGPDIKYCGAHCRVYAERGRPDHCEHCSADDGRRYDWAYAGPGHEEKALIFSLDPADYISLCISCHRKFDKGAAIAVAVGVEI